MCACQDLNSGAAVARPVRRPLHQDTFALLAMLSPIDSLVAEISEELRRNSAKIFRNYFLFFGSDSQVLRKCSARRAGSVMTV